MSEYKTPGVYIVEKKAFPNSVVAVETAIPIFIGYTEKASNKSESLIGKPLKISSLNEYQTYFGGAPNPKFTINNAQQTGDALNFNFSGKMVGVIAQNNHTLYYNLLLFFANGGGSCYILSVGEYSATHALDANVLWNASSIHPSLFMEQELTMLVIPEAVNLGATACYAIQKSMLAHCTELKNRVAILDVYSNRYAPGGITTDVTNFRNGVDKSSYGAAYYPWLATSVLPDNYITGEIIAFSATKASGFISHIDPENTKYANLKTFVTGIEGDSSDKRQIVHQALLQNMPEYKLIVAAVKDSLNLLPPSSAMAGLYTMVDNTRGVWKAPANISVNSVIKPAITITDGEQQGLNAPDGGKSINAIRSFIGSGIKVWGARTLDGDSLDWRYINVRRTMIFLEASIKNAARSYVFEPNEANTWLNMKCMIENFLRGVWKLGGLVGASPEDAYSVHVGLGETMTPEDILEGIMRIVVLVAVSHPAEFIEITFQQQMQKS